ncbi:TlpA disulfide reductase family protein [Ampullimonas aquatilis]|uniref:TlpA disulfide reductase family protein n=1 Tax=Ampullimonas aquatilis TaxID=1341549 RepID=UPI003C70F2A8
MKYLWLLCSGLIFVTRLALALDVGKPAPNIESTLLNHQPFTLSQQLGQVVIINFWATWCGPCRQEMPDLENFYQQHRAEGLKILAISMDDPADDNKVREVMQQYSFDAAFSRDVNYKGLGRIWRMPMTYVIDRQGIIRKDGSVGEPKIDFPTLEALVTPLLKQAAKTP